MSEGRDIVTVQGMPGFWEVLEEKGEKLVLLRGGLRLEVGAAAILSRRRAQAGPPAPAAVQHAALLPAAVDTMLDLHGMRVEEALKNLEKFLDDARAAGHESVVVIHGHGTRTLEKAVKHWLKQHGFDSVPHQLSRRGFTSQKVRLG